MNRAELVEILASKNDLSKTAANAVLDTLIDTIQTAVKKAMPFNWWVLVPSSPLSVPHAQARTHRPAQR